MDGQTRPKQSDADEASPNEERTSRRSQIAQFAAYLAEGFECDQIVDVGGQTARELAALRSDLRIAGIHHRSGANLQAPQGHGGMWVDWDLSLPGTIPLPTGDLSSSVILCVGILSDLAQPSHLLRNLASYMHTAPVAVISGSTSLPFDGAAPIGRSSNGGPGPSWTSEDLEAVLQRGDLNAAYIGETSKDGAGRRPTPIAIIEGHSAHPAGTHTISISEPPSAFRVVALMTAYNEEEIIAPSIARLLGQGIQVYLLDNWSTDSTVEQASQFLGRGLIGLERFPAHGPSKWFDWRELLTRVEALAGSIRADWFIHHDVDEARCPPWPGMDLRQGIFEVDQRGYNCIDHCVLLFHPVDDGYPSGGDFEAYFRYFEFGTRPGHFVQVKAWKNLGVPISLAEHGGHQVTFPGRRVFPYKFLLKHYPILSQRHGERKIFVDRRPRWNQDERAIGWHVQYDHIQRPHRFIRDPSTLMRFDESFYSRYLIERLSGVGVR